MSITNTISTSNLLSTEKELKSEILAEEYEQMTYNVHKLSTRDNIVKKFPKLEAIKEFALKYNNLKKDFDKNKVVKYIILAYDKNSPYRRRINEMNKRKQLCALAAGFTLGPNGFDTSTVAMLLNLVPQINIMIVEYVRHLREPKFSYLIALEQKYYTDIARVMAGDEKVKLDELEKTEAKLDEIVHDLLAGDRDQGIKKDIFDIAVYKEINMRPEAIAIMLAHGKRFESSRYI